VELDNWPMSSLVSDKQFQIFITTKNQKVACLIPMVSVGTNVGIDATSWVAGEPGWMVGAKPKGVELASCWSSF